jgi:hypothetical protein
MKRRSVEGLNTHAWSSQVTVQISTRSFAEVTLDDFFRGRSSGEGTLQHQKEGSCLTSDPIHCIGIDAIVRLPVT